MSNIFTGKSTGYSTTTLFMPGNGSSHNCRKLPPPPDVRHVVMDATSANCHAPTVCTGAEETHSKEAARPKISSGNTTLIGDYVAASFDKHDKKWLVQATGNATFQSLCDDIRNRVITVDRSYIFFVVGHNQIRQISKASVYAGCSTLVDLVRRANPPAKIFSALLPRLVDNQEAKPLIVKFNRALATAINRIKKTDPRVILLPVQHAFIKDTKPIWQLYEENGFMLNKQGVAVLKHSMFAHAGFVKNT